MAKFEWDESKRQKNLRKHGLDFKDAEKAFADDYAFTAPDQRYDRDARWLLLGRLDEELVVVIAYKEIEDLFDELAEETFRIISMRPAEKQEIARYEQEKVKNLPVQDDPLIRLLEQLERDRELKEQLKEMKEEAQKRSEPTD